MGKPSTLDGEIRSNWVHWNDRKNKVKIDKAKGRGKVEKIKGK